LVTSVT